ncbi:hypothetical protein FRC03_006989 [Tulasnella sp. 419]|nr:hypothetical protein FRC02_008276 [Tulasnella sp. 418]KAG8960159.1 hypothetical protein FRC03_006989 [Tulasnella sp. 419]
MHSVYARANNLSAFLFSCLLALAGAISVTTFVLQPHESAVQAAAGGSLLSVSHGPIAQRRVGHWTRKTVDVATLNFNLTADLTPLFHWNTKQLFVYVTADYEGKNGVKNTVVIWDKIVRNKDQAALNLVKQKPKYNLRDYKKSWKDAKPATYTLHYDIMPYVGILTSGRGAISQEEYPFGDNLNKKSR